MTRAQRLGAGAALVLGTAAGALAWLSQAGTGERGGHTSAPSQAAAEPAAASGVRAERQTQLHVSTRPPASVESLSDHQRAAIQGPLTVLEELEGHAEMTNDANLIEQVARERLRLARAAAGLPRDPGSREK